MDSAFATVAAQVRIAGHEPHGTIPPGGITGFEPARGNCVYFFCLRDAVRGRSALCVAEGARALESRGSVISCFLRFTLTTKSESGEQDSIFLEHGDCKWCLSDAPGTTTSGG